MELNEMEKRMLYQTEGCERYAVINELSIASQYAGNPARRKAAKNLMEKLRPLSDTECMDLVRDIQKNYRLPQEGRTIGELIAEARQKSGAEKLKGHDIMALERFDPEVRHMIVKSFVFSTRNTAISQPPFSGYFRYKARSLWS